MDESKQTLTSDPIGGAIDAREPWRPPFWKPKTKGDIRNDVERVVTFVRNTGQIVGHFLELKDVLDAALQGTTPIPKWIIKPKSLNPLSYELLKWLEQWKTGAFVDGVGAVYLMPAFFGQDP